MTVFAKKKEPVFNKKIECVLKINNKWELIESVKVEKLNNINNKDSPKKKKNNQNANNK